PVSGEHQHAKSDQQARQEAEHLFVDLGGCLENAHEQAAEQARHHQYAYHQDDYMDRVGDDIDGGVWGQHGSTWEVMRLLQAAASRWWLWPRVQWLFVLVGWGSGFALLG